MNTIVVILMNKYFKYQNYIEIGIGTIILLVVLKLSHKTWIIVYDPRVEGCPDPD